MEIAYRLLSVEDYHKMIAAGIFGPNDRVELINGQILQMRPIGSQHAACVEKSADLLKNLLPDHVMVRVQNPVMLPPFAEPEPDLALVKTRSDYYATAHPGPEDILQIIEVADSSLEYDQTIKKKLYAASGVPVY